MLFEEGHVADLGLYLHLKFRSWFSIL